MGALLLLTGVARLAAAGLEASERSWAEACMRGLDAPTERVRAAAIEGLARLGADAVPVITEKAAEIRGEAGWDALGKALVRMGASATDLLDARRAEWPESARAGLGRVLETARRELAEREAERDVGVRVRKVLENFRGVSHYTSQNPEVWRIVSLGRGAVPALLEVLAEDDSYESPFVKTAAAEALEHLATRDDLEALAKLARDGSDEAAGILARFDSPLVVDALLDCVKLDMMSYEMSAALSNHVGDPRVVPAVVDWLARNRRDGGWRVAPAVAVLRYADGPDVVEPLIEAARYAGRSEVRLRIGQTLVWFGSREGARLLVQLACDEGEGGVRATTVDRRQALATLEAVAGKPIAEASTWARAFQSDEKLLAEAKPRIRAWWAEVKETLEIPARRFGPGYTQRIEVELGR